MLAKRSKELPFGGELRVEDLGDLVEDVRKSILWAEQGECLIDFDARARKLWPAMYSELGQNEGGRLGAIIDRAEPQVRRLALVYAAMARSSTVTPVHLRAALEVWRYCEQSAAYLFGDAPSLGVEGRVERVLRRRQAWTARSNLYRDLERSGAKSYSLESALNALKEQGRVEWREVATGGRPRTEYRWKRK